MTDLWERRYHALAAATHQTEKEHALRVNTLEAQLHRTLRVLDQVAVILNREIPSMEPVNMTTVRLKGLANLADSTSNAIKGEKGIEV